MTEIIVGGVILIGISLIIFRNKKNKSKTENEFDIQADTALEIPPKPTKPRP